MKRSDLLRKMRKSKFFMLGVAMGLILLFSVLVIPEVMELDPIKTDLKNVLSAPQWFSNGLTGHIFGTDGVGRDMLARLLYGGRTSLMIVFLGMALPSVIGIVIGVAAGYYGGVFDVIVMRIVEIILSLPQTILAIATMAILGANTYNLVIVLLLTSWVGYCRMARSTVMQFRNLEFVQASKLLGASDRSIMFKQILPNCFTPLIISSSQQAGRIILIEASLSFLGCGVPPPDPTWGLMIAEGRTYITYAPWTVIIPGLFLMYAVLAFSFLGDGIRDVLDPKNKD